MKSTITRLKTFFILWVTQSISQLGSAMTGFALSLWIYDKTGSALQTALLRICSYAPYILMSIFAGALSDKWDKKKVMLVCDTLAALTTVYILILLNLDMLCPMHIYILNALNGLMNTIQQPASDVAMTLITPKEDYQRTSGLCSFSQSLTTILNPIIATALFSFGGMNTVIFVDLLTFGIAFFSLLFFIQIPNVKEEKDLKKESFFTTVKGGLLFLKENPLILTLILFLAGVNLVASTFDAVLPAYVLPRKNGGKTVLSVVCSFAGIATLVGSMITTFMPKPKNRIRVIYLTMLFSLSIENFMLAFCRTPIWWCISQIVGWLVVPIMSANLSVILRSSIPVEMQGRVYSCRNTLQFFTIPIGLYLGGICVDQIFEPFMAHLPMDSLLVTLFGSQKGSGAALMMFIIGIAGTLTCLVFGQILKKYHYED